MGLGLAADDAIATATALTAATVAASVPAGCARVIVSGGGAHNRALLDMLRSELRAAGTTALVEPSDAHGVAADAKEALAFAVLASEAVAGRVNHLRRCTGAAADAILGKIVPGANFAALMNRAWTGGERLP